MHNSQDAAGAGVEHRVSALLISHEHMSSLWSSDDSSRVRPYLCTTKDSCCSRIKHVNACACVDKDMSALLIHGGWPRLTITLKVDGTHD